jgi:hypothetical protein
MRRMEFVIRMRKYTSLAGRAHDSVYIMFTAALDARRE